LPVQIIDSRKLPKSENIWLKDLHNKLNPPEYMRITSEIQRQGKEKVVRIMAYFDAITRANLKIMKEVRKMNNCSVELKKIFEETGWATEWKAKGRAEGKAEGIAKGEAKGIAKGKAQTNLKIAKKMKKMGDSVKKIQAITGLPADTINRM